MRMSQPFMKTRNQPPALYKLALALNRKGVRGSWRFMGI